MFLNSKNYEDGEKYFGQTYVKIKEYGDTICLVEKVTPEAIWLTDEHDQKVCVELDGATTGKAGYNLDFILPKKTWFQMGNVAYFLTRIPARMWKKGISKSNTTINCLKVGGFLQVGLSFQSLHAYVHKPFYSTAEEMYKNEWTSVALSPRFALCKTGELFLDQTKIGVYDKDTDTLVVKKVFVPDVLPLFNPSSKVKSL